MSAVIGERDTLIMHTVPRYSAPIDRALLLTASATMFEVSAAGVPTPAAITLSALMLGAVGEIAFSSEPPVKLTVANGDAVLKFEDMTASIVTVSASTVIDGLTYYARQTLAKQQMLDLRPPPAPAGLAATGHPATISLTWAAPPVNYNNLSHTEVWRATVNDFSKAALVGRADGREFTDPVGAGVFRYYWIRYISRASIPGPYNNSSGTVGASDSEVEHLLGVLTEKLTQDQLASSLSSKIDLIEKLEETYGDTASAAASAAAAALSEAAADKAAGQAGQYEVSSASSAAKAQTEAARASSFSGESTQSATNAKGSAAAAENSAIVAAQSANTAGQSAQSAVISSQNASSAADNAKGSAEASAQFLQQAQAILTDPITGLVDKYAAVKVQADATADSVKGVVAKYGVQVDADGVSGGFEVIGGGRQVSFGVRATTFSIAAPLGSSIPSAIPFIVRTTETVIGGVTIPIGVYISDAFIQNASITNAKIGGDIWSSNYLAGQAGWRLNRAGNMEVNNLQARGHIAGGGHSRDQWPADGQGGFYLGPEGLRLGNEHTGGYFRVDSNGDIYTPGFSVVGRTAIFSGALAAASGTLGVITAGYLQNAANTTYLNLNATGVQTFLYAGGGRIRLNADGSGTFARSIISEPNVVRSGKMPISVGWRNSTMPFTVYVDTGETFSDLWYEAPSAAYIGNATLAGGQSESGGLSGYVETTIVVGGGLYNGTQNPIGQRIYLRVTWTPGVGPGRINPAAIAWKLVKV